ncbi:hypothetical protein I4U23_004004 [Adineta vaga]|nr:hypothetical protein I4U23_004004 [Adineta vaga]
MVGTITGDINYLDSTIDGRPPWSIQLSIPTTMRTNFAHSPIYVPIHDLRGKENSVNLDTNALEIVNYNGSIQKEFGDGSEEQKAYYKEIEEFLKKHLGATHVIIYHHSIRSRSTPKVDEECDDTHRNPVFYPHVDLDPAQADKLIKTELVKLGKDVNEKEKIKRFQIINTWRPLGSYPIIDKPLTICDYRSININKDVHTLIIHGKTENTTAYTISRNTQNSHLWYYLSQMRSDEMFMFKIYDSKPDVAQYAFHTAFHNGNGSLAKEGQKRASRVIVCHHCFRSRGTSHPEEELYDTHRNPEFYPHTDIDTDGTKQLVKRLLVENGGDKE